MTVGEILEGNASADHELFDEQETGKISLTLLSMTNKTFSEGTLRFHFLHPGCGLVPGDPGSDSSPGGNPSGHQGRRKGSRTKPSRSTTCFSSTPPRAWPPSLRFRVRFPFPRRMTVPTASYQWDFGGRHRQVGQEGHPSTRLRTVTIYITASNFLGSKEATRRITVNAPTGPLDADELGNRMKSFDWFGAFTQTTDSPWIFHRISVGSTVTGKPSTTPGCGRICGTGVGPATKPFPILPNPPAIGCIFCPAATTPSDSMIMA